MKGTILAYSAQNKDGIIVGEDENRYSFEESQWKEAFPPQRGVHVDFVANGSVATEIYKVAGKVESALSQVSGMKKSKIVAGVLALCLGCFGIHKFYLGHPVVGVIYLLSTLVGWMIIFPPLVIAAFSIVDAVLYLVKTDEDFENVYVTNKKAWF